MPEHPQGLLVGGICRFKMILKAFGLLSEAGGIMCQNVISDVVCSLFIAWCVVWRGCWRCFGRHWGSPEPLKIISKRTTIIYISVFGALRAESVS